MPVRLLVRVLPSLAFALGAANLVVHPGSSGLAIASMFIALVLELRGWATVARTHAPRLGLAALLGAGAAALAVGLAARERDTTTDPARVSRSAPIDAAVLIAGR